MDFSGFDDFVEIFRGGVQMDNRGRRHDGDRLIDRAVAGFDPAQHEPPVCVGHPTDNAPAFGWVSALKDTVQNGRRVLLAKFKDVVPEFADLVRRGVYKKRSAAFYPDGRLRHVGFLGAAPPAVKGLADIGFADDGEAIAFDAGYQQGLLARMLRRVREFLIEKNGADTADRLLPDWEIEELGRLPEPSVQQALPAYTETPTKGGSMKFTEFLKAINLFKKHGGKDEDIDLAIPAAATGSPSGQFTEADLEAAKNQAAEAARAEFAEAETRRRQTERAGRIKQYCDDGVNTGKIAPAWIKAGLPEFMEQLADDDGAATAFSEGGGKKTPEAWFREFLEGLPRLVNFSEIATRGTDAAFSQQGQAEAEIALGVDIGQRANR